jgi:hypothetical protein
MTNEMQILYWCASKCWRGWLYEIQVIVTRTDIGATTKLVTNSGESSKKLPLLERRAQRGGGLETHQYGTRTDAGATTAVMSSAYEWSKSYASWDQALDEAVDLQLLNKVESATAKMMPPGFPFHCSAKIEIAALTSHGFNCTKEPQQ